MRPAGALNAFGFGFVFNRSGSLAILVVLLSVSLASLAWKANQRNGYKPLALGILAAALIFTGKWIPESNPTLYIGYSTLLLACIGNAWPIKQSLKKPKCCQ